MLATGLAVLAVALGATSARGAVSLGTATTFAVLANTTITNTGATTINGDVGLYPGTAVTGFGTVTRNGALHVGDAVAQQALVDAGTAYRSLQSRTPCMDLTGSVLGQTVGTAANPLLPGVYCFTSSAQLTGDLYLSGGGEYIFRIGSTLTTASGSHVILQNGADACNVFWAVGSSATLGTNSRIVGTIIANVSITANTGAVVDGRLFALTGAVTLDSNTVGGTTCPPATTTTAPATTTTAPATTTTTSPGATTTTSPGATTTTAPGATTTTTPSRTTTTAPPGTTTTAAPATTTTSQGATPTTAPPGLTTTIAPPGTTTTAPLATTTTPTSGTGLASPGALLSPPGAGLRMEALARTGQGLSGPLSAAIVLIFLGSLLLLGQRGGGAAALATAPVSGVRNLPGDVGRPPQHTAGARVNAAALVEGDHHEGRAAPGAGSGSGSGDLMHALERQLQEADARLARLRATDWLG